MKDRKNSFLQSLKCGPMLMLISLFMVTGCASNQNGTLRKSSIPEQASAPAGNASRSKATNPTRPSRGSSVYERTLHALSTIAPDGNHTTFAQAATAHELLERALSSETLKANEARALDSLMSVFDDAMVCLGCLQKTQEICTSRAQAFLKQGKPYSLEALYRKIIEDIRENEAHLNHPEFRARLLAERAAWEDALAAVAHRIASVETDYRQSLAVRQRDYVNRVAHEDSPIPRWRGRQGLARSLSLYCLHDSPCPDLAASGSVRRPESPPSRMAPTQPDRPYDFAHLQIVGCCAYARSQKDGRFGRCFRWEASRRGTLSF